MMCFTAVQCCFMGLEQNQATLLTANVTSGLVQHDDYDCRLIKSHHFGLFNSHSSLLLVSTGVVMGL